MSELEDLVARYLERREREPELTPEAFASEHPEHAAGLRAAILRAAEVEGMFDVLAPLEPAGKTPQAIGPYAILGRLGRGGMGVVFEARRAGDPDAERVALKVLPLSAASPRALARFEREARTLTRLSHRQIVAARDFGVQEGSPYLVMDLVEGRPLDELAAARTFLPREAAELVASLARAVQAAHEVGVLHRDLKPQNVIVRPDGIPILVDFGLVADEMEESLTSSGDLLGTPRYMAPEQAAGRPASPRTDVHALGVILYELAAGLPAFPQESREKVLTAVRLSRFAPARRIAPHVPRELDRILRVAMAWNPARRYASPGELADDLERFMRGLAPLARPPSFQGRLADAVRRRPAASAVLALSAALCTSLVLGVLVPWLSSERAQRRGRVEEHLDRAVAAWIRGRLDAARERVDAALALDRGFERTRVLSALLAGAAPDAASPGLRALLEGLDREKAGDRAGALERFHAARSLGEGSSWSAVLAARAQVEVRAREAALVAASRELPGSVAVAQELGFAHSELGDHPSAEREYRRAIELDAHSPILWQGLALALFHQNKDEEALSATRRSIELKGAYDPGLANVTAALLDRSGRREEAREILERLVREHPRNAVYAFNLAFSLDSDALVAQAKPLYERVLELDPGHASASVCLAWLLATAQDADLADPERAEQVILDALERDRGHDNKLVRGAHDVARKTGRVERIADLLARLAEEGEVDARAVLLARTAKALREGE